MVIIRLMDGLGNQMFQGALYYALKHAGKEVRIDIHCNKHNGFELEDIFGISLIKASYYDFFKIKYFGQSLLGRFIQKLIKPNTVYCPSAKEAICYQNSIFQMDNVYLSGYWQSEKFFSAIQADIRSIFSFKNRLIGDNHKLAEYIKSSNSVSLHVRRGDYVYDEVLGNVVSEIYYNTAVDYINQRVNNPVIFCFSNDINWCKTHLKYHKIIYVNNNFGDKSYFDLQLMSMCKHNIISNSTFSWWGAWLNNNKNKIVISPHRWNNIFSNTKDIVPDSWIKI